MPYPEFITSFANKAQSALNASPLAQHLPGGRPVSPDAAGQPSANEAAAQGGKSHTLEAIQYQLRSLGQQYNSSTTPIQRIITTEKGVAIDFDSVSRDAKAQSKELYTWGQSEQDDLKDVTDRLAYLNFVQGSLASSLAVKLDAARAPLKALRDAETALAPRRNIRAGLQTQLVRIEHDQQKGMEKKTAELKEQIRKAEADDLSQEREVDLLKRNAVRDSEQLKWEAIREYAEKLVLLSQASAPIIAALPTLPPTATNPYTGSQSTGAARASLQRALDNYKTGHINLPPQAEASDLSRSDTRSFGETHATELSALHTDITGSTQPGLPMTPPGTTKPLAQQPYKSSQGSSPPSSFPGLSEGTTSPPPINPINLNNSPAPIPPSTTHVVTPPSAVSPDGHNPSPLAPVITPTIAETGVPVSAGTDGPGPASGSLHDIKGASASSGPRSGGLPSSDSSGPVFGQDTTGSVLPTASKFESAEEEKKRLQQYSQVYGADSTSQSAGPPAHESAEEEKKRLEREERERVLRAGGTHPSGPGGGPGGEAGKGDDLPPYQDI